MTGPELYPDFEEATQAVLESDKLETAVSQFCKVLDTAFSERMIDEARKTFAAQVELIFSREKNRAKDTEDEDAHADNLGVGA